MWPSESRWWLLAICLMAIGCSSDEDATAVDDSTSTRTVLAYIAAENSLSAAAVADVNEMLAAASTALHKGDRLIVYIDNTLLPRIYEINSRTTATSASALTPVKAFDEELDSGSASTLAGIINWTINNYAADSYGLILWSHATGWLPSNEATAPRRTFAVDNNLNTTANTGTEMNIDSLALAVNDYHWQFILFDACFMQSMEVADYLNEATDFLIASPAEIPFDGAPYTDILADLFAEDFDATPVVEHYIDAYATQGGCLLSAIDCSRFEDFANATAELINAHADELLAADLSGALNYFDYDSYYYKLAIPDCYDLQGLLMQVATDGELADWQTLLAETVIQGYSPSWYSSYPATYLSVDEEQYSGISLFVPLDKYTQRHAEFITAYHQTPWAKRLTW